MVIMVLLGVFILGFLTHAFIKFPNSDLLHNVLLAYVPLVAGLGIATYLQQRWTYTAFVTQQKTELRRFISYLRQPNLPIDYMGRFAQMYYLCTESAGNLRRSGYKRAADNLDAIASYIRSNLLEDENTLGPSPLTGNQYSELLALIETYATTPAEVRSLLKTNYLQPPSISFTP